MIMTDALSWSLFSDWSRVGLLFLIACLLPSHFMARKLDVKLKSAVIIGAGPTGLCSALMLESHGWKDITVIEKRSISSFESEKAYQYLLSANGQRITDYLNLTSSIAERSVSSFNFTSLTEVLTSSEVRNKKLPVISGGIEKYWLPRSAFLDVLLDKVAAVNANALKNNGVPSIKVHFDTECTSILVNDNDGKVLVNARQLGEDDAGNKNDVHCYPSDLLMGCDGINSVVRTRLASGEFDFSRSNLATDATGSMEGDHSESPAAKRFQMIKFASDAAGLRYKMLTLKNRFRIPSAFTDAELELIGRNKAQKANLLALPVPEERKCPSIPESGYVIRSLSPTLKMGLLPVLGDVPRTANFICRPEHELWQYSDASSLRQYIQTQFPQVRLEDMVSEQEIARFAASPAGVFPRPQYCTGLHVLLYPKHATAAAPSLTTPKAPAAGASTGTVVNNERATTTPNQNCSSAIVLAGDCIHAFPPDLGQGVNSALDDVYQLHLALKDTNHSLEKALPLYEKRRAPEAEALCKLMVFGYPHQYGQAPLKGKLYLLNFALRLALNKALPAVFSPPAFYMIQFADMTYQEVLRRAHRTTRRVLGLMAVLGVTILWPLLRSRFLARMPSWLL